MMRRRKAYLDSHVEGELPRRRPDRERELTLGDLSERAKKKIGSVGHSTLKRERWREGRSQRT
jgi:hypothetical protein